MTMDTFSGGVHFVMLFAYVLAAVYLFDIFGFRYALAGTLQYAAFSMMYCTD